VLQPFIICSFPDSFLGLPSHSISVISLTQHPSPNLPRVHRRIEFRSSKQNMPDFESFDNPGTPIPSLQFQFRNSVIAPQFEPRLGPPAWSQRDSSPSLTAIRKHQRWDFQMPRLQMRHRRFAEPAGFSKLQIWPSFKSTTKNFGRVQRRSFNIVLYGNLRSSAHPQMRCITGMSFTACSHKADHS
jgi:hypothetical protein